MAFLILPSSRLASYSPENNYIKVLPIRAEEFVENKKENVLAVSSFKNLTSFNPEHLHKAEHINGISAIATVQFNKKL